MSVFVLVAMVLWGRGLPSTPTVVGVYQTMDACMTIAFKIHKGEDPALTRPMCMSAEIKQ